MTSYLVDTPLDVVAEDGMVSLREALMAANTNQAVNEAAAGQTPDTAVDSIAFSNDLMGSTIELNGSELVITESVVVSADSGIVTIDGQQESRVLHIESGAGEVVLDSITIQGGLAESGAGISIGEGTFASLRNVSLLNNQATGDQSDQGGGGLLVDGATVLMTGGTVGNNTALGTAGSGGGILNAGGDLTIRDVDFVGNVANRAGGAIEQFGDSAQLGLHSVSFSENVAGPEGSAAPGNGGALHLSGSGDVILFDVTASDNYAASEGGGLWNGTGRMTVIGSTIRNNTASGDQADNGGGGIFNNGGTLNIFNSDIVGNTADGTAGSGGGVFSTAGTVTIDSSAIESNVANRAGGGIEIVVGDLTMTEVMLGGPGADRGNVAGPEGSASPGNGGGLHVTGDGGSSLTRIVITGGVVQGNRAASEGGGLWNQSGARMTVSGGTRIGGNRAKGETSTEGGGGIFNNGGVLSLASVTIANNASTGIAGGGGGIANDGGSVSISDSFVVGNFASGASGSGGGFSNFGVGTLTITRTEVSGNVASRAGGGIEDASDTAGLLAVTLDDSILSDNIAGVTEEDATAASPGNGGGIHVTGQSDLLIRNSEVTENLAASEGGGLWNGTGTMTVESTSIMSNRAFGNAADNGGGGVFNNAGTVVISNSIVHQNAATGTAGSGGGLFNLGGSLTITDSRISENIANRAGGGIEQAGDGATLQLNDTDLIQNVAGPMGSASPGNGGGVHISGAGDATIIGGLVEENHAAREGGGLWNGTGLMTIDGVNIVANVASGAAADDGGGGVFNNGGDLVITASTISGNIADGTSGSGGGLLSLDGDIQIDGSSLEFNGANRAGGGIEIISGELLLIDSNLINNDVDGTATGGEASPGNGGGIHVSAAADVTVDGGVIFGNIAASEGGGLWNQSGATMTVIGALIEGNIALGDAADNGGGGVFNNGGSLVIEISDLIGNIADGEFGSGGAIQNVNSGTVVVRDSVIADNIASRAGGGIEDASRDADSSSMDPSVTLIDTIVEFNNAGVIDDGFGSGSLFSTPGNGGGIHLTGPGVLAITGGAITDNIAGNEGGGLWNSASGTITITDSAIENNSAPDGGGIYNDGGFVSVSEGNVSNNVAHAESGSGGGIYNVGTLSITSTTVSGNVANRAGGGIESTAGSSTTLVDVNLDDNIAGPAGLAAPGNGGGLHITGDADATITGGSVSGNFAAAEGGGLWNSIGTMTIQGGVIIANNLAAGTAADQGGGGVFNNGGTLNISDALIQDNSAAATTTFSLGGEQEVPPVATDASGTARFSFDTKDQSFDLDAYVVGIELTELAGAHIHLGAANANGPVIVNLGINEWINSGDGIRLRLSDIQFPSEHIEALAADGAYINIHTADNPPGEIRGQIVFPSTLGSGGGVMTDGGTLTIASSEITGNIASRVGGGVEATAGSEIVLNDVLLENNVAGPSDFATPGNGGGLHLTGDANATITDGIARDNSAGREGGGLWNGVGTMTIDGTLIDGNVARGDAPDAGGGGIFNVGGDLLIANATIAGNLADGASGSGGGLLSRSGSVEITDTSFEFNGANRAGGGIEVIDGTIDLIDSNLINNDVDGTATGGTPSPGNGGGLHVTGIADVSILGGVVFGNFAASEGGGLWNQSGSTMTVQGTLFDSNGALGDDPDNGGGALFNNGGLLVISDTEIVNNFADGNSGSGGGILNDGGELRVQRVFLADNFANRAGGGIEQAGDSAFLDLDEVTFDSNVAGDERAGAPGNGGGLHIGDAGDGFIRDSLFQSNSAARDGGGIWNGAGTLTVIGTTVKENVALGSQVGQGGGGIYNLGTFTFTRGEIVGNQAVTGLGNGGGLLNARFANGSINNTIIDDNMAARAGGGVENEGNLLIGQSSLRGNSAGINGGALHISGFGVAILTENNINKNTAGNEGGGLWNSADGLIAVQNSLVSSNTAVDGAGLFNDGDDGDLRLVNTTISGNVASGMGGGIRSEGGEVLMTSVTVAENIAASGGGIDIAAGIATLASSIVGTNSATSGPDIMGQVISEGFNVIGDSSGAILVGGDSSDQLNVDPKLESLTDNGGDTFTHALQPDSPAINAGDPNGVPADQRRFSRPQGPGADSGAFESELPGTPRPISSTDVNSDGETSPLDALMVINFLAQSSSIPQSTAEGEQIAAANPMDVNGDGSVTPLDALTVINDLVRGPATSNNSEMDQATMAIDAVLREQIDRRKDEIDDQLIEQLALGNLA